jgi:hypothetical protein
MRNAMETQGTPLLPGPVSHIFFRGCSDEIRTALRSKLPFREGDILSEKLLEQAREAARSVNEHLGIRIDSDSREELLRLPPEARPAATVIEGGVNVTIIDRTSRPQRIRVAAGEQASMLLESASPDPPPSVAGVVRLAIVIGHDGAVIDALPLAGPEPLIPAALDAVGRWRYRPTLLNGRPVEVQTTVEIRF